MENIDSARVKWINENLGITFNMMSPEDLLSWVQLSHDDVVRFMSYGVFGFINRRIQERNQKKFDDSELKEFCAEFSEKIRRVATGDWPTVGLPLFEIVGRARMNECVPYNEACNGHGGAK